MAKDLNTETSSESVATSSHGDHSSGATAQINSGIAT